MAVDRLSTDRVFRENEIIEWVSANCADQDIFYLDIRSQHIKTTADTVVSFNCG